jgi:hypothetical protein
MVPQIQREELRGLRASTIVVCARNFDDSGWSSLQSVVPFGL